MSSTASDVCSISGRLVVYSSGYEDYWNVPPSHPGNGVTQEGRGEDRRGGDCYNSTPNPCGSSVVSLRHVHVAPFLRTIVRDKPRTVRQSADSWQIAVVFLSPALRTRLLTRVIGCCPHGGCRRRGSLVGSANQIPLSTTCKSCVKTKMIIYSH